MADKHREEISKHEAEIQKLKKIVARLEERLGAIQEVQSKPIELKSKSTAVIARTCEELRLADQSLASDMYWIDPDGHGAGDAPIHVFCNMTSGNKKKDILNQMHSLI